jgi:hypothetical protein
MERTFERQPLAPDPAIDRVKFSFEPTPKVNCSDNWERSTKLISAQPGSLGITKI